MFIQHLHIDVKHKSFPLRFGPGAAWLLACWFALCGPACSDDKPNVRGSANSGTCGANSTDGNGDDKPGGDSNGDASSDAGKKDPSDSDFWDPPGVQSPPDPDFWDPPEAYGPPGPYAEALQKALHFYDANMSGIGITGGRLQWRGNSEVSDYAIPLFCNGADPQHSNCTDMSDDYIRKYIHIFDPDGIGTINVGGGFHDCGDHVKFGLPQAYSASMLGWAMYEFPDAFIKSGQGPHALDILKRFTSYFLRSTFRERDGRVIAFAHQVGVGSIDHSFWGPPELQKAEDFPRPARFATEETPGADVASGAAAALAIASMVMSRSDADYAAKCLDTARALYAFADKYRGAADSGGFYPSEYEDDDLAWAAVWLHIATGEDSYIDDIVRTEGSRYTGHLGRIMSTTEDGWYNAWVHCWNTVWSGMFVKLAQITGDEKWTKIAEDHVNLWSGLDGDRTVTPGGLSFLSHWGTLRYNTAAQMTALVWAKHKNESAYVDWAESQMQYIFGDNPLGKSYIVGFGDSWPVHVHHRAAHGSTKDNSLYVPETPSHTAWGALLGGPTADDSYIDDIWEYTYSEVCVDYASSLVSALAGLYHFKAIDKDGLGQAPLADIPPLEKKQREIWVERKVGQDDVQISEIKLLVHNETFHPPHFDPLLSIRYFFSPAELKEWNQGVDAFRVQVTYDGRSVNNGMLNSGDGLPTIVSGPFPWNAVEDIYYFDFAFTGCKFYGSIPFEFQLVAEAASDHQPHQDSSNDFSRQGLPVGDTYGEARYVAMYSDGELIAGEEP